MGSRGAFINIDQQDFRFKDGGKIYTTIKLYKNIQILIQQKGSVKVPDFSHSSNAIYAILQNGEIKGIGIYENHEKVKSIDLKHQHTNDDGEIFKEGHYHTDLFHSNIAFPLSKEDKELVGLIKKLTKEI